MSESRRPVFINPAAATWRSHPTPGIDQVDRFHRSLPGYEPTPLISLDAVASELGVGSVHVKAEVDRFGLPAFKILGASWASFRLVTETLGLSVESDIEIVKTAASSGGLKLFAATEGNHGRAIARMASMLSISAEIHVAAHTHPSTIKAIASEGCRVIVSTGNYDTAIKDAAQASQVAGGLFVQDHAFDDYLQVPQWIVDGYLTTAREVDQQLGPNVADLVIAPVGVGSFAQAITSHFKREGTSTSVVTVEPDTAACLWKSLKKGQLSSTQTLSTIMAGMNCGTPSSVAWDVLKNGVDASVTVSDFEAHMAVQDLHAAGIPAGPCGAAPLAALRRLTAADRQKLGLNDKSRVVLFCTERTKEYETPRDVSSDDPVTLAQTLIQIDSSNPSLGSTPGPGEIEIAQYVVAWLEHRNLETHWIEPVQGRPSVIGVARGTGGGKSLMLNGHLDTVTLLGYEDNPLSGKIVDGRLYGRGACDMKAGVAANMVALVEARKRGLAGDVVFAGVADEEALSMGTENVLAAGWWTDAAVVTEPTDHDLIHAHKGYVWFEVTIHGVAAHGSDPDTGVDAIIHAGYFLAELGRYAERLQKGSGDASVGTGTVHASKIKGGEEIASYPATCRIEIERRTIPGETDEGVEQEFRELLQKVTKQIPTFKWDIKKLFSRPTHLTPKDEPFLQLVKECASKELGEEVQVRGAPYWTDCALLSAAGIVPVLWGPAGFGLHGKEEYVEVASIRSVTDGLVSIAAQYCA
ncbi:Zn-dependent exopeptidase [Sarocladium strictum]